VSWISRHESRELVHVQTISYSKVIRWNANYFETPSAEDDFIVFLSFPFLISFSIFLAVPAELPDCDDDFVMVLKLNC